MAGGGGSDHAGSSDALGASSGEAGAPAEGVESDPLVFLEPEPAADPEPVAREPAVPAGVPGVGVVNQVGKGKLTTAAPGSFPPPGTPRIYPPLPTPSPR